MNSDPRAGKAHARMKLAAVLFSRGEHQPCGVQPARSISNLMTTSKMRKQVGFSLIELLIVVAIILIIAAIAIPNLLRAKMSANESSAVGSIRAIQTAEISYASAYPTVGFAPDLVSLGSTASRSEEHTSELQSQSNLVCRLLLEKKKAGRRGAAGRAPCGTPN